MYEFDANYEFNLRTVSSVAVNLRAQIAVLFRDGKFGYKGLNVTTASDRTVAAVTSGPIGRPGKVVGIFVSQPGEATSLKRGQCFVNMHMGLPPSVRTTPLLSGYQYGENRLVLGKFSEPLGGFGRLDWEQIANDVAGNVVTTYNMALTNARRLYRGFLLKYHADSTVATRNVVVALRDVADTSGPTGFSIDGDVWATTTMALTQDQEGILYINASNGAFYQSINDNGSISILNNSTTNTPFPIMVDEGDTADLVLTATNGVAGDDYDAWVLVEEWIEP